MQDLRILSQWVGRWSTYNVRRLEARLRKKYAPPLARAVACEGMMHAAELRVLYELARDASPEGVIVEIGSYRGASTIALAQGSLDGPNVLVFAIDPHDFTSMVGHAFTMNDSAYFMQNMLLAGVAHLVRPITLFSHEVYDGWRKPISLLWIDGDHSYDAVKQDFERFGQYLLPDAVVAFHDSKNKKFDVYRLIDEIRASEQYDEIANAKQLTA